MADDVSVSVPDPLDNLVPLEHIAVGNAYIEFLKANRAHAMAVADYASHRIGAGGLEEAAQALATAQAKLTRTVEAIVGARAFAVENPPSDPEPVPEPPTGEAEEGHPSPGLPEAVDADADPDPADTAEGADAPPTASRRRGTRKK